MVFNPARIAQSYTQGLDIGEARKQRGLDQDRIRKEESAKAKQAARQTEIEGLASRYAQGDTTAESELMAYGSEGLEAAKSVQDYQTAQTTSTRDTQQFDREGAERELTENLPRALTITDPDEWNKFEAWARPRSLAAGTSPEMYDQVANMPMAEAQDFLRKQMQGEPDPTASGGIQNVEYPDGRKDSFDLTNPESRAAYGDAIREGAIDVVTRAEVDKAGAFTSGGDVEMRGVRKELLDAEDNASNLLTYIDDIKEIVKENPDVNALGGSLAKIGLNLVADIKSTARLLGSDAQEDMERILEDNEAENRSYLKGLGIETARVQSAIIGLAYQASLQANDRVTDNDYKAALKEIGSSYSNPEAFVAVLDDYGSRAIGRYENKYSSRRRMYPEGAIGEMKKFDAYSSKDVTDFSTITLEELNAIDPNTLNTADREAAAEAWDRLNAAN